MGRQLACAAVMVCLAVGGAGAEEFVAFVTKVQDGQVTFAKFKISQKIDKGEEKTLPAAKDVKVFKVGKVDKDTKKFTRGEAVEDGLKNELFQKIDAKGLLVRITTDQDNKTITEIIVLQTR